MVLGAFNAEQQAIRRYKEYKTDFERLNTAEVQDLFLALDIAVGQARIQGELLAGISRSKEWLGNPLQFSLTSAVEEALKKELDAIQTWWIETEMKELDLEEVQQAIRRDLLAASTRVTTLENLAKGRKDESEKRIKELQAVLKGRFEGDTSSQRIADLRANAERRLRRVAALRDEYLKQFQKLGEMLANRSEIVQGLIGIQGQIAEVRQKNNSRIEGVLNRFLPDDLEVRVQFVPNGDTKHVVDALAPLVSAAVHYKARKIADTLASHFTPPALSPIFLDGSTNQFVGLTSDHSDHTLSEDDVTRIADDTAVYSKDEDADVATLRDDAVPLRRILDLQEAEWDDHELILLNGEPVNEKSPGQRSSALLPLVALSEHAPLVIDQPEDNLDKKLVGDVLVRILAELKENRQMIVCTHDPNILVGGDAEQVVVLEALGDREARVKSHGSIDNSDIIDTVLDLLEGGSEAFAHRRARYAGRVS